MRPVSPERTLISVRALYGSALLVAPDAVLRALPHQEVDGPARAFARVLGGRHLAQAAIVGQRPTRGWILAGAAADATHASTMLALALLMPNRRKLALTNAAVASAFTAAGLRRASA